MKKSTHIEINIKQQSLKLFRNGTLSRQYRISTARNGPGEKMDSECTPRGNHYISEKIGADAENNTVFVSRLPTGEFYAPELREKYPDRDWILTRILWLSGSEKGRNQGGDVDSHERYIYIHGAPDDIEMGKPGSRGCIRMRNKDVVELFDLVDIGTQVDILEK